jgi:DNA primase catalytic core
MIPAEAIVEVKARHELVAFVESCGIPLKRSGKGYLGLCRFHEDHRPSLSVDPARQYWCCLGACSAGGKVVGGDVIEFARRLWGVGFREALERLGGTTSAPLPPPSPRRSSASSLHLVESGLRPPRPPAPPSSPLLSQVVALYHQGFLASAEAKEYAASRGLTNPDLLAALPMGYANGTLLERAPEGSQTYEQLRALGVVNADEEGRHPRELLSGCLVVPLRDLSGNVVSLYGRAIDDARGVRHLYLPGPRRGLVNAQCAATCDELILTESVLDALSFLQAGIPNAVPLYGTNGWTSDHEALIEKHRIRRVVLALDSDEAGRRAAPALAGKLCARGIEVLDVVLA